MGAARGRCPAAEQADLSAPKPELCFFDLGDVAARFVPERRLPVLAELLGAPPEAVREQIWGSGLSSAFDTGAFSLEGMCDTLGARFARSVEPARLAELWCLAFEADPAVLALARGLQRTMRVGLLTNNPPALEHGLPRHHAELARLFDPVHFSCSLGVCKPEPELYARVEQTTGLAGAAIALIDDSARNVEAAAARGWHAIHFTDAEALATELERRRWL